MEKMGPWLKNTVAFSEGLGSILSIHVVPQSYLYPKN